MNTLMHIKDKSYSDKTIKIEPFRKHVRKTVPHKHKNYFEIVFLTQSTGSHTIDEIEYNLQPPIVFSIRKDQVHHWDITSIPDGFVLIIKNDFVSNCIDKEIKQLIYQLSKFNCIQVLDESLLALFQLLHNEYKETHKHVPTIVEGLIKVILGKLLQYSYKVENVASSNDRYFHSFETLLNTEGNLHNSVAHYAQSINTTPQNLNSVCKKETGKTASQFIAEHIIAESKRLLLYTDLQSNEICEHLNFKDASHFVKYFRRHQGLTPDQFRKQVEIR